MFTGKRGEAVMSDALLLLKVEDLIGMSMGPPHKNVVNFKILQSVLHILARQMRLLEQAVDVRLTEDIFDAASDEDEGVDEDAVVKRRGKKQKGGKNKERTKDTAAPEKSYKEEDRDRGREGGRQGRGGTDKEQQKESSQSERDYRGQEKEKGREDKQARRDQGREGGRQGKGGTDKQQQKESSQSERDYRGQEREKGRDDKQSRRDQDRADADPKDKESGEKSSEKGEKRKDREDRNRDKKETERESRGITETSERGGKDHRPDREGRQEKAESVGKSKDYKGRSEKEKETDKGRDKTKGSSDKDRDRSEKDKVKDKDRSEKDSGRDETGGTFERGRDREGSGKDKRGKRDGDDDSLQKSGGRSEVDSYKPESDKGRGESRGTSKRDGDRDIEDVKRSDKSISRSERDTDGTDRDRGKDSSRGSNKKERGRTDKDASKKTSGTSIAISERELKDQKIIIVEKGPTTTKGDSSRVGSIEVVTQSQFKLLEQAVRSLEKMAAPLPPPTLPDNKKLRSDIAKGSASLTDTMQAMQITARVQAAEKAIQLLTELTSEIAAKGGMPKDLVKKATALQSDAQDIAQEAHRIEAPSVSQAGQPKGVESAITRDAESTRPGVATLKTIEPSKAAHPTPRDTIGSQATSASRTTSVASTYGKFVTVPEMDDVLSMLREELVGLAKDMTARAHTTAETAALAAADLLKKMDIVMKMNERITALKGVLSDYAEQLSGFDVGLGTQMSAFKEQMGQLHKDLHDGLVQLANVSNNAETAAVLELNERCEGLNWDLKETLHYHENLTSYQRHLSEELRSLVECVEMMREQKADREEVQDGLRDKADSSRLEGLLSEVEFDEERQKIELRLDLCHAKFNKQEATWIQVMRDFGALMVDKAEYLQLVSIKEQAEAALRDVHARVHVLADILGDPKTAMITRQLAKNGVCAACRVPAVMPLADAAGGAPRRLPAARPPPAGASAQPAPPDPRELCVKDIFPYAGDEPPEGKSHMCRRWVGGSHTMVSNASRERPPPFHTPLAPVKRYVGVGSDDKPYKLVEDLLPCVECNPPVTPEKIPGEADGPPQPSEVGAGDQVNVIKVTDARRVTIIDENKIRQVVDADIKPSTASIGKVNAKTSTSVTGGDASVISAFEDKPRRLTDIGNVVKGRVTNIDENAIRRASIRHDTAMRRATISDQNKDKSQRPDREADDEEQEKPERT